MRIPMIICASSLLSLVCYGQAQHTFWPFGFGAGVDFSGGAPVPISSPLSTDEGCTSICDANGQLLFYSNGETVWDRNNTVMPNGSGLFGSYSASQSVLTVPFPDDPDRYYLFTAPAEAGMWAGQPNAAYSVVDMTANNGAGGVVTANVLLDGPVTERLTATRHANGRDVWVLYHRWQSDAYLAYLVTCLGVEGPVISNIGRTMIGNADGSGAAIIGCMKLDRQGTRLANAGGHYTAVTSSDWLATAYFDVLDFDNRTGRLTNIISDSIGGTAALFDRGYGVEFSPNGSLVYMSDNGLLNGGSYSTIRQYDLSNADPMNTEVVVASGSPAFGTLQLGPDGRLYSARLNGATYLSAINSPNVVGVGCDFVNNAVSTGSDPSTWGLPNHWDTYPVPPPDDLVDLRDTLLCALDEALTLDATWSHPFHTPSYLWSTGEITPSIRVSSAGTYMVEVQLPCSTLTDTVVIRTGGVVLDLGADRSICEQDPAILDVGPVSGTVLWSTGDTARRIAIKEHGNYSVMVADTNGCVASDEVFVNTRNCQCPLYLPNAFTPNGDGINDELCVGMECEPTSFEFVLFDRWGHAVHNTFDPAFRWSGDGVPVGVYAYSLNYAWLGNNGPQQERRMGTVTLVR